MITLTELHKNFDGTPVLRGASLPELANELAILVGFIAVAMTIAVARFHKRLD